MREKVGNNIVVVCDDQSILDRVNCLLCRGGIISMTDIDGKTQYLVDARDQREMCTDRLDSIIDNISASDNQLLKIIEELLCEFDFNFALIGTRIFAEMIRDTVINMDLSKNMKQYYLNASERYAMSNVQVERDVRYALSRSKLPRSEILREYISDDSYQRIILSKHKTKNLYLIRMLAQIAFDRYNSTK